MTSNPSGFITGIDLSSYAEISFVTGVSGDLNSSIQILESQTGDYYQNSNPSGFITGINAIDVAYDNILHTDETHGLNATDVQNAIDELEYKKLNVADLTSNLMLFPTTAFSTVTGYTDHARLVTSAEDPDYDTIAQDVSTGAITGADQLVGELISDSDILEGNVGLINITTIGNIKKVGGNKNAVFYFKVFKYNSVDGEVELCESSPVPPVTSSIYEQFSESALIPAGTTFTASDHIIIRYYATPVGSGNNPTYNFQFGGDDPVRTLVPVPATVVVKSVWSKDTNDIYYNDGNVGIGTDSPSAKLHVVGGFRVDNGSTAGALNFGADVGSTDRTSNTRKLAAIVSPDYANTRRIEWLTSDSGSSFANNIFIGGRVGGSNYGATNITLATTPTNSTTGGIAALTIDGDQNVRISSDLTVDTNTLYVDSADSRVGIGTTTPSAKLHVSGDTQVDGHFSATTKSFLIDNPNGGKLQYGVVESNEHGVYVRGKTSDSTITLPEHWEWLVDADSVTVQLTPVGKYQSLYVIAQTHLSVEVGGVEGEYNYTIYGTRKDVEPLTVDI